MRSFLPVGTENTERHRELTWRSVSRGREGDP